ncbi:MAG TPA: YfiR family protein [Methylophilaceae bacterium]|nr:YfiR family protein [Methylophilaceae bacterium]
MALAWLLLSAFYGNSQADDTPEDIARQVKAAYIFKFANYIEWPASSFEAPDSPIVIGVTGADQLADELTRISANRLIGKRPVTVKRLTMMDSTAGVHILYLGGRDNGVTKPRSQLKGWVSSLQGQPLLSIADATQEFAETAVIKFVIDNNRLRFDVSLAAAERNHLKVAAPLLTVARRLD